MMEPDKKLNRWSRADVRALWDMRDQPVPELMAHFAVERNCIIYLLSRLRRGTHPLCAIMRAEAEELAAHHAAMCRKYFPREYDASGKYIGPDRPSAIFRGETLWDIN